MKGLTTTEQLMKKKEYKDKGRVMLINAEFNDVAEDLLNTNNKKPTF